MPALPPASVQAVAGGCGGDGVGVGGNSCWCPHRRPCTRSCRPSSSRSGRRCRRPAPSSDASRCPAARGTRAPPAAGRVAPPGRGRGGRRRPARSPSRARSSRRRRRRRTRLRQSDTTCHAARRRSSPTAFDNRWFTTL